MLVLTRRIGEKIIIGDDITISISAVKGDSVRVAIDAPRDIKVYRGEIHAAIIAENQAAATLQGTADMEQLQTMMPKKE